MTVHKLNRNLQQRFWPSFQTIFLEWRCPRWITLVELFTKIVWRHDFFINKRLSIHVTKFLWYIYIYIYIYIIWYFFLLLLVVPKPQCIFQHRFMPLFVRPPPHGIHPIKFRNLNGTVIRAIQHISIVILPYVINSWHSMHPRYPPMFRYSLSSTLSTVKHILHDVNCRAQNCTCKQLEI